MPYPGPGKQAVLHECENLELLAQTDVEIPAVGDSVILMTNLQRPKKNESTGIRKIAKGPGLDC